MTMEVEQTPDATGETSRQGLRRMKRMAAGTNALSNLSQAACHSTTGTLILPAPFPHLGHAVSSLYPGSTPRRLPTPSSLPPSRDIAISPEGEWITLFHPQGQGGTLAIYPQTVLSPFATAKNVISLSTLPLPTPPLDILHLYPPRIHLPDGQLASAHGPLAPPGYHASKGPAMVVLLPDALLFVYPQRVPGRPEGNDHQMNVLRAPLHTRCHVRLGESMPSGYSGKRARKGWLGLAGGDTGVWVATSNGEDVDVARIDIGMDELARWYVQTTPMPRTARIDRDKHVVEAELLGVYFTLIPSSLREQEEDSGSIQSVGMVTISQEVTEQSSSRARLDLIEFARRPVVIGDAFDEISGQSDVPMSWDWTTSDSTTYSSTLPDSFSILDIYPLIASTTVSPGMFALVHTTAGTRLARLSLEGSATSPSSTSQWSAIKWMTSEVDLWDTTRLVASPEVRSESLGLICLYCRGLNQPLSMSSREELGPGRDRLDIDVSAKLAAQSIWLAIQQGTSYSACISAAFGYVHRSEMKALSEAVLKQTRHLMDTASESRMILEMSRVQIAVFGLFDGARRDMTSQVLRLLEASHLIDMVARVENGSIVFNLEAVSTLVRIADWVMMTLGQIMRHIVMEKGRIEWGSPEQPPSLCLLYLANPLLRAILLRLLGQMSQLTDPNGFVQSLNRPIQPSSPLFGASFQSRHTDATMQARDQIRELASGEGVDINAWGQALVALQRQDTPTEKEAYVDSFLQLSLSKSTEDLAKILSGVPDPSSLFRAEKQDEIVFDRITFKRLPRAAGSRCDRCQCYTVCWVVPPVRPLADTVFDRWKEAQRNRCGCGGAWSR